MSLCKHGKSVPLLKYKMELVRLLATVQERIPCALVDPTWEISGKQTRAFFLLLSLWVHPKGYFDRDSTVRMVAFRHQHLKVREMNSHVDPVTPFHSVVLLCQQSPHIVNIQLHVLKCTEQEQLALVCRLYSLACFRLARLGFVCG